MSTAKNRKNDLKREKALIIYRLSQQFQVTDRYVRMAVRGDVKNENAEEIKREYNRLMKAIDNVFKG